MFASGIEFHVIRDSEFPGWWAKMEAFKIPGPVLYMDLSCAIVSDLTPLLAAVEKHDFIVTRDFNPHQRLVQSCVMGWSGDMSYLYDYFVQAPGKHMAEYTTARWWGDQGFIEHNAAGWKYWQDVCPGKVVSYKKGGERPAIINYHGRPKPWEI